ncbi:MAG TPA: hypothetical protein DEH25_15200 [Chloroflexi bacterium]|nr:hypothetical protein [Chloroflexota bacterium]
MGMKNITVLDLIEAAQAPGCLMCTLRQKLVEGYIRGLFNEHINDPPSREKLRHSHGLCPEHSWLAIDSQLGNALGVAIISQDVIGKLLNDLADLESKPDPLARLKQLVRNNSKPQTQWFAPEDICPACQHKAIAEERIQKTLMGSLHLPELSEAIAQSDGICLPHLRLLLALAAPSESTQILLDLTNQKWQSLRAELAEFIRKNDYRFSKEGFGDERDSWLRATALINGNHPGSGS